MTKLICFLLSFCYAFLSMGQERQRSFRLTITPLSILDVYNGPNIRLGGEFHLNAKTSSFTAMGVYVAGIPSMTNNDWQGIKGFYVVEEIRRYWDDSPDFTQRNEFTYWGIEASYGTQAYTRNDSVDNGNGYRTVNYYNQRTFAGVAANIGAIFTYKSPFYWGFNFGFGLRYNKVINNLTMEEALSRELGDYTVPTTWIQKKGTHIIPKFNIGLKIGYCFN